MCNEEKNILQIYEDNLVMGLSTINLLKCESISCVIIESDNKVNPADYTQMFFDRLKDLEHKNVYLDLSNLYGLKSKNWFYKWKWITDQYGKLYNEEFLPISEVHDMNELEYEFLKKYLYTKLKPK